MVRKKRDTAVGDAANEPEMELGARLKSEVGERPRVEVRVLKINTEGKLEELSCFPLSYYGSCPNVGDTIIDGVIGKTSFYSIQRRYFVAESIHFSGWGLIVREIDPAAPAIQLWEEWQDATEFWDDVANEKESELYEQAKRMLQGVPKPAAKKPPAHQKPKSRRKKILKPNPPS